MYFKIHHYKISKLVKKIKRSIDRGWMEGVKKRTEFDYILFAGKMTMPSTPSNHFEALYEYQSTVCTVSI